MQTSEESPLAPFDPEIERTFLANKRKAASEPRATAVNMADKTLRDLWIPKDQAAAEVVMPVIQANN